MKGLLIYKGKYGATEQYAGWIGKALGIPATVSHEAGEHELEVADYLIIGSSVYIGMLVIKDWLRTNLSQIAGKPIFLFVAGGASGTDAARLDQDVHSSIPESLRQEVQIYLLPGRTVYRRLSLPDRILLRIQSAIFGKKNKGILADYDAIRRENIEPIVNDVRKLLDAGKIQKLPTIPRKAV